MPCDSPKISVVIPLYNKSASIALAVGSVLGQTTLPLEVIIVDDGSTDGSGDIADRLAAGSGLIRVIHQQNAGVSAARNRAIAEARGEYVALLDGDDAWHDGYLAEICRLIGKYPGCGAYSTGFYVCDGRQRVEADTPRTEGVVDFFAESLRRYVLIPSAATLRRETVLAAGGFPVGMRMGEDQYLWTKMARMAKVCFSPVPLADYSRTAENRSATIFRAEDTPCSFEDLYDPDAHDDSNEYIARVALGKALVQSAKGGTAEARRAIKAFGYTRRNRRALLKLKVLNSLPVGWRQPLLNLYNRAAWILARKGL